ncbi:MAG: carbohydrate binding family 9 domain-containing protein [Bacteroidales bacterium]|nr:carbohydrate binding family 9 domain-containing protein [Bacteroidales bacterium]
MNKTPILLLFLLQVIFIQNLTAQNIDSLLNNKRVYNSESIGKHPPPKIDGLLDDEIWTLGKWQGDFTQQFPFGGKEASENTFVKVMYDRSNLYVAFICQDSEPDKIRDILGRRDARSGDNAGIALDSYYDKRTAFEFSLTAAGQKMDLKHLGDYHFDFNWDAVWDGATSRNDTAWIAEMKLPFSQIRYANRDEHVWGLHFYRVISRKFEADNWQYIPREAPAMVYLFGELKGIKNIRTSRQVEFLPYALGSLARFKGNENTEPFKFNGGLDAKVGISSDYTLDLSVNPDFGQVEADPSVLNLTSFETFFEEKRPFFLEGNDVFDFEMDGDIPYYSRRIGSAPSFSSTYNEWEVSEIPDRTTILGAAKLTGKNRNGLSVGLVNGLTARELGRATDDAGLVKNIEVSPMSNYVASRLKRDFKDGNTIVGGVFSLVNRIAADSVSGQLLPTNAISGGLDLLHHWKNRNYYLEVKTIASQLNGSPGAILKKQLAHNHRFQRPDADYLEVDSLTEHLSGHGGLIRAGKKGGKWNFFLQGQYRSPGLNLNDMGYIRQSDFMGERIEISYDMNEPGKWIRDYYLQLYQEALWSFGGENTGNQVGLILEARNNWLWWLKLYLQYDFTYLDIRELRGGPALRNDGVYMMAISVGTNTAKDLYAAIGYQHRAFGMEQSNEDFLGLSLTWLPIKRLKFSGIARFNQRQYHQQYVTTISENTTDEYIVGNIDHYTLSLTFRGELFITPELSLQYYGSPYYSVGKYDSFRRIDQASSKKTSERWETLDLTYDPALDSYSYERNSETFRFDNPDFSFMQFRSNLVFRWEYKLGSTIYVVWSHDRSGWESMYNPVRDITGDLFGIKGNHVIMVKLNFWFSV